MDSLVFDIGAFKGEYTDRYLAEGARVIAVEPRTCHAEALRKRYADKPVTVVEGAVGAAPGRASLYNCGPSWFSSLYPERWAKGRFSEYIWRKAEEVEVITLDDLIERFGMPGFIKIDTEGAEPEVMAGLTKPAPLLSFEFTVELLSDCERCMKRLEEVGDYEFAISYFRNDLPGIYKTWHQVMDILKVDKTPLLWGNIYARLRDG